uniref:TonB-dependent transporter Oar-like beta-barrel domain-containing protein n=1 Tax=mine drainage metagenome TaxID=410659 RepID=E6QIT5_9ZZZZ
MKHRMAIHTEHTREKHLRAEDGFQSCNATAGTIAPSLLFILAVILLALFMGRAASAQSSGRITGVVKDPSGAVVSGSAVELINTNTGVKQKALSSADGVFTFPVVAIGAYDMDVTAQGFNVYRQSGIQININSSLDLDVSLTVNAQAQNVIVNADDDQIHVATTDTQLGQVVQSKQVLDVPLNGRSYTDLFAIQPGVTPITTSGSGNSTSGGGFGTVPIAGEQNTGQFSINGQRESDNAFFLNGTSVQEAIGEQAGIIPNLDSIAEFRILSANVDAEYGSFSGGLIDVVTKSGTNAFHGSIFDFLRDTSLDATQYFTTGRSAFQQNQFGGTFGGPIHKNSIFFFTDYQGQRTTQGIDTGIVSIPSVENRGGNFSDAVSTLSGQVNGPYLAQTLSMRLGYPVQVGEPFYSAGCTQSTQCVFPNAAIPQQAFSSPATHMLQYIPAPNIGANEFSSGNQNLTIDDNKGSGRIDLNSNRYGNTSFFYFLDQFNVNNPYPSGLGGATVPGPNGAFNAISLGSDQTMTLNSVKTFGASIANEARIGYTRLNNHIGTPVGGVGTTLAQQGITKGGEGIVQGYPQQAGVEMLYFNTFAVGTNPFSLVQISNTYDMGDTVSMIAGNHTMKAGGRYIRYLVLQNPNLVANGTFSFFGAGEQTTGNGFADFLLGLPDYYSQQSSPPFHESATDADLFAQDSWRIRANLTINYGIRWDMVTPWSEQNHMITTFVQGVQSQTFPGAPLGYLVPGDILPDGHTIPAGIAPTPMDNYSPRFGIAYSPAWSSGKIAKLTGGPDKTSIRLGAGRFFSSPSGLTVAYPTGNPPYGLTYTSQEPPVMATPFMGALTGTKHVQQFPVSVPPENVSPTHPDNLVDWSLYTPIGGAGSVWYKNKTAYTMQGTLAIERQIGLTMAATVTYVGSLGRHLLTVRGANPGVPSTCLSLSQLRDVATGAQTCGPFGENNVYVRANGAVVNGTRAPFPNTVSSDAYYDNMGNSHYNALEMSFQRNTGRLTWLASYTFGKSYDQTSSIQEQVDPYNYHRLDSVSAFDIKHDFVVTYNYKIPVESIGKPGRLTKGWELSGITRFSTGLPVTFASNGDNSQLSG